MIRKANLNDVELIYSLVEANAKKGNMLARPRFEIYKEIRSFFVFIEDGEVIGTSALAVCLDGLGEVRSLTVKEGRSRRGVGSSLVTACIDEARELGLTRIFALTYTVRFFEKMGFKSTDKENLPHKIWGECVNCAKFPNCDENAVILDL